MKISEKLKIMETKVPGSVTLAGKLNLEEELFFMSKLDLMIAMDSSNMHMAALVGNESHFHMGRNGSSQWFFSMDAA